MKYLLTLTALVLLAVPALGNGYGRAAFRQRVVVRQSSYYAAPAAVVGGCGYQVLGVGGCSEAYAEPCASQVAVVRQRAVYAAPVVAVQAVAYPVAVQQVNYGYAQQVVVRQKFFRQRSFFGGGRRDFGRRGFGFGGGFRQGFGQRSFFGGGDSFRLRTPGLSLRVR